jgi:soluble lytic murein transglycosylase-like protein
MLLLLLALIVSLTTSAHPTQAQQAGKTYQQMTHAERSAFISEQARRIAREMSGTEYEFTASFEGDIQQSVNQYSRRIGENGVEASGKRDVRLVFERGAGQAPALIAAFKARHVSPLIGLYIPWVESEYVNLEAPNSMGAIGMFQFLPQTGEKFGLSAVDLLDIEKSADAAARYIAGGLDTFKGDPMKETLALLSYNRGTQRTVSDVKLLVNDQNKQCSICALTADRSKLDESFRSESVFYVPRFFAAAIIGENPQAFGLQGQPLSAR